MRNIPTLCLSSAMNSPPLKQSIFSLHAREADEELDDVPCPKAHHVRLDCPMAVAPTPLRLLMTLNKSGLEDGSTVYHTKCANNTLKNRCLC